MNKLTALIISTILLAGCGSKSELLVVPMSGQTLLTQEYLASLSAEEKAKNIFTTKDADTTFQYSDAYFTVDLPYNYSWGNEKYLPAPYEFSGQILDFWNIWMFGQKDKWNREYSIIILDYMSSDTMLPLINEDESVTQKPTLQSINWLEVIKYIDKTTCDHPSLVVVGKSQNYVFLTNCSKDTDKDFAVLQKIVETMKIK